METIVLASDHRGFELKAKLAGFLKELGYGVLDVGTQSDARCDSQDFAVAAAKAIKAGKAARGIIMCGSGNMIAMAANRFPHIRAAVCAHALAARMARLHNDANMLSIGADFMGYELIKETAETFLKTEFLGDRYAERVERLTHLTPNHED